MRVVPARALFANFAVLFASFAVERLTWSEASKILNRKGRKENRKGREESPAQFEQAVNCGTPSVAFAAEMLDTPSGWVHIIGRKYESKMDNNGRSRAARTGVVRLLAGHGI